MARDQFCILIYVWGLELTLTYAVADVASGLPNTRIPVLPYYTVPLVLV